MNITISVISLASYFILSFICINLTELSCTCIKTIFRNFIQHYDNGS